MPPSLQLIEADLVPQLRCPYLQMSPAWLQLLIFRGKEKWALPTLAPRVCLLELSRVRLKLPQKACQDDLLRWGQLAVDSFLLSLRPESQTEWENAAFKHHWGFWIF